MKAELVYGRFVKVEDKTITIEVEKGQWEKEEVEDPLDMELEESFVADTLGKYFYFVVVDGKVKSFRSP
jgi:hypothetical protein